MAEQQQADACVGLVIGYKGVALATVDRRSDLPHDAALLLAGTKRAPYKRARVTKDRLLKVLQQPLAGLRNTTVAVMKPPEFFYGANQPAPPPVVQFDPEDSGDDEAPFNVSEAMQSESELKDKLHAQLLAALEELRQQGVISRVKVLSDRESNTFCKRLTGVDVYNRAGHGSGLLKRRREGFYDAIDDYLYRRTRGLPEDDCCVGFDAMRELGQKDARVDVAQAILLALSASLDGVPLPLPQAGERGAAGAVGNPATPQRGAPARGAAAAATPLTPPGGRRAAGRKRKAPGYYASIGGEGSEGEALPEDADEFASPAPSTDEDSEDEDEDGFDSDGGRGRGRGGEDEWRPPGQRRRRRLDYD